MIKTNYPIQLTIDRIRNKYSNQIIDRDQSQLKKNSKLNNQIKQIEVVNNFQISECLNQFKK